MYMKYDIENEYKLQNVAVINVIGRTDVGSVKLFSSCREASSCCVLLVKQQQIMTLYRGHMRM